MGFPEKFNRYYTDPAWKPSKTVYVSPDGGGDGATRETPMAVKDAVAAARPGTQDQFPARQISGLLRLHQGEQRHLRRSQSFFTPSATRTSRSASR